MKILNIGFASCNAARDLRSLIIKHSTPCGNTRNHTFMPKYKIASPTPPSDLFVDSLGGGGSHHMNCGFCGRDHYCPDSDSIYEDDVEEYQKSARAAYDADNEGVVLHFDYDSVSAKDLNGISFVVDCPCNGLAIYEKFIWADRDAIRQYLGSRIQNELAFYEQERTKNVLAGIEPDPVPTSEQLWSGRF